MDKTLSVAFMVLFLLVGVLGGYVLTPEKTVTNTVTDVVYQNVTVEKLVEVPAPDMLSLAVAAFLTAVEDEDINVLGRYDFDEMEVNRVYDEYTVNYDDEITTVDFKIRLRFDEDDARAVKKTYNVTVIFDTEEDTFVNSTKI